MSDCVSIRFYPENINHNSLTNHVLVLDLDETLIHTFEEYEHFLALDVPNNVELMDVRGRFYAFSLIDIFSPAGTGEELKQWGLFRNHIFDFLNFANSYFRMVVVWTAAKPSYAEKVVDRGWRGLRHPAVIYGSNQCRRGELGTIKPLMEMINSPEVVNGQRISDYMSLKNTFAIDDNFSTFSRNTGNGILIPPYDPEALLEEVGGLLTPEMIRREDTALLQLKEWFMRPEVIVSEDVRLLDKSNIFF